MIVTKLSIQSVPSGISAGLTGFLRSLKTYLDTRQPSRLPVYTAQQLNATTAADHVNEMVVCSNGDTGDACLAFCDGFNWRVVSLGDKVSQS